MQNVADYIRYTVKQQFNDGKSICIQSVNVYSNSLSKEQ